MHEAGRVRVGEPRRHLVDQVQRDRPRRHAVLPQQPAQVAVGDELAGDPEPAAVLAVGVDRDHVLGHQRRLGAGLAREPLAEPRVVRELGRDHLERHRALEPGVPRLVHDAHAAAPEAAHEAVRPERLHAASPTPVA
ncbi:hypothetical protein GCM10009606_40990 [Nocardioides aquiterrae]|uniref:Uncharacterized protein n=1 Tax=Nocardioides aquiterrae TaxID=203799 RepID=A0ABP4F799_9ACTN